MGVKRSGKGECLNLEIYRKFLIGLVLICTARNSVGVTNPSDVTAINSLYISLGSPLLPGWVGVGGIHAAKGGKALYRSEQQPHRGSIPSSLPVTLQTLYACPLHEMRLLSYCNDFICINDANHLVGRRLQNNQLSGTLDVLQDLPLSDLYYSQPRLPEYEQPNAASLKTIRSWKSYQVDVFKQLKTDHVS
ncbi:unnamed protein product [Dovyalis caffra]|uniref:Uncharacterized protein n=1 Tax=Dovyalis caffra TaxID=77055 RepID=A0AAV1SFS6_9ROSI|nr:unnamed protein product [Dovyalis caffra]